MAKEEIKEKKVIFNKKQWREQKYSNKAKVQKWDEARRKHLVRDFNREQGKSGCTIKEGRSERLPTKNSKFRIKEAQSQYNKRRTESENKKAERERVQKERAAALKKYRDNKATKFKKLSQKTRKGQPVMKGRMELLLEKIQKQYSSGNR